MSPENLCSADSGLAEVSAGRDEWGLSTALSNWSAYPPVLQNMSAEMLPVRTPRYWGWPVWLPRKRAKTERALGMYPVADEAHLISENIYIQSLLDAFLMRIPKMGRLFCSRCCVPLGMSLKANSPLAWPPWSEESPNSSYLCGEGEVHKREEGRGRKSGSRCRKGRLFNSKREFSNLVKKAEWFTLATWLLLPRSVSAMV